MKMLKSFSSIQYCHGVYIQWQCLKSNEVSSYISIVKICKKECVELLTPLVYMSHVMRKPDFCIWENKGADQLRGNHAANQLLYFRHVDNTTPLPPKTEVSSL